MNAFPVGLTFDDVLLVPRRSPVSSRRDVDTRTTIAPGISLHIPIVSANMDTVTEMAMALAMAREGGIGILHRFLPVAEQVAQVERVKRSESIVIDRPWTLGPDATIREARALMLEHGVAGLPIVAEDGRLAGILTARDLLFEDGDDRPVKAVMTGGSRLVTAPEGTSIEKARQLLREHRIEKLPLVDGAGRLRGLITSTDIVKRDQYPHATKDQRGRLRVGAAVGVRDDFLERATALAAAGADLLVVDVAHGHSDLAIRAVERIRAAVPAVPVIAGNVATADGFSDLACAGAVAVKVGVGPGSICTTRVVTGSGVPQLSAILDCARVSRTLGVPIIADGGIRGSGDLVKALGAGAAAAMCGNLLGGTEESPGQVVLRGGRRFKVYRGMASFGASLGRRARERGDDGDTPLIDDAPEGVEAILEYRGTVAEVLRTLTAGLRSGMSYCGARDLSSLRANARFVRMTGSGQKESGTHDVAALA